MEKARERSTAVVRLGGTEGEACADVLAAAFAQDPTLRYVIGDAAGSFPTRLRTLVGFFVRARVLRDEPMLGVREGSQLVAVALASFPWVASPEALNDERAHVWDALGPAAHARYEEIGRATAAYAVERPHVHLNMLGVLPASRRAGHGGRLAAAVQDLSADHPTSQGVALVAEGRANLAFYRCLGYVEHGRSVFGPGLELWMLFRDDDHDRRGSGRPA